MRSIQQLIQYLLSKGDTDSKRLFDTLKQTDDNMLEVVNRVTNLEKKNMRYFSLSRLDVAQNVPSTATITVIWYGTNYPQFGNMHSDTVENTKIHIRRNGVYYIGLWVALDSTVPATVGFIQIAIVITRANGTPYRYWTNMTYPQLPGPVGMHTYVQKTLSAIEYMNVDDYITVTIWNMTDENFSLYDGQIAVSERMEDLDPSQYGLLDPSANMR